MASVGQMRDRVSIIEVVQGQGDNFGGYDTTKSVVKTVWAFVEQQRGSRESVNNTTDAKSGYQITMRAGSYALTTDNLLEWDGTEMKIESLTTDHVKRYTIVQANGNQ